MKAFLVLFGFICALISIGTGIYAIATKGSAVLPLVFLFAGLLAVKIGKAK